MQRDRGTSRSSSLRRVPPKRRVATRLLAGVVGGGACLLLLYGAGIDPWRWWLEYRSRADSSSTHRVVRPGPQGPIGVVQPTPIGTDSSISQSSVPLILRGTRKGRNAREGYAELGVSSLSPQTYRAGAVLANGARIEEIYPDYIVLARGGQRVRLYVQGHEPRDDPRSSSPLLNVGGSDSRPPAIVNSQDELTDYIRVTPVYRDDAVHAIEVYANDRSGVFARLGLEPGDRITAIDGETVSDAAAAIASLRRLTRGEALQVTVERNGRLQILSLDGLIVTATRRATTG